MTAPIGPFAPQPVALDSVTASKPTAAGEAAPNGSSFVDRLKQIAQETDALERTAESKAADFADGKSNDIHGTMVALQEADVQLRFAANIRNRVIEAYREVMRMGA